MSQKHVYMILRNPFIYMLSLQTKVYMIDQSHVKETSREIAPSTMNASVAFWRNLQRHIRSDEAADAALAPTVDGGAAAPPVESSEDDSAQAAGESQEAWWERSGLPPVGFSPAQLARWGAGDVEWGSDSGDEQGQQDVFEQEVEQEQDEVEEMVDAEDETEQSFLEKAYRDGGFEEETGFLVQPGAAANQVQFCIPHKKVLDGGDPNLSWAIRVDGCVHVSVRLEDGHHASAGALEGPCCEVSCSCADEAQNLAFLHLAAEDRFCIHVRQLLRCARLAIFECMYGEQYGQHGRGGEDSSLLEISEEDAWRWLLLLRTQAVRLDDAGSARTRLSKSPVFEFSYELENRDAADWTVYQVGELDGDGSYSLDGATHPVAIVMVKRWGGDLVHSCLTCTTSKSNCGHTDRTRAVLTGAGSAPQPYSRTLNSLQTDTPNPEPHPPPPSTRSLPRRATQLKSDAKYKETMREYYDPDRDSLRIMGKSLLPRTIRPTVGMSSTLSRTPRTLSCHPW